MGDNTFGSVHVFVFVFVKGLVQNVIFLLARSGLCSYSSGMGQIAGLGFAKYSKKSNETQIRYTLKRTSSSVRLKERSEWLCF